jgi:nucleoside-diphosphate kinase
VVGLLGVASLGMAPTQTVCLLTPSCVGRKWLVESQDKRDESSEENGEGGGAGAAPWSTKELAADKAGEALKRLSARGFSVREHEWCVLTTDQASKYVTAAGAQPDADMVSYLTSGPVVALLLERENAVEELLRLLGPADPEEARELDREAFGADVNSWSMRGAFGVSATRQGVRGSASALAAAREIAVLFPERRPAWGRTLALVDGADAGEEEALAARFGQLDLCVVAAASCTTPSAAQAARCPAAAAAVGGCTAVVLEGFSAVQRLLLAEPGPLRLLYAAPSPEVAADDVTAWFGGALPVSRVVLAAFGKRIELAAEIAALEHGLTVQARRRLSAQECEALGRGDQPAGAALVLAKAGASATVVFMIARNASLDVALLGDLALFPQLDAAPDLDSTAAKAYIKKTSSRGSKGSEPQLVQSLLISGLTELCRTKPAGLDAVRALGEWLLLNNPDREAAARGAEFIAERARGAERRAAGAALAVPAEPLPAPTEALRAPAPQQQVVVVLGAPGVGKSAQCRLLAEQGYSLLSPARLLQKETERQQDAAGNWERSELGKRIEAEMRQNSGYVSAGTAAAVLALALPKAGARVVLDDFPRDLEQVAALEDALGGDRAPQFVLVLAVADDAQRPAGAQAATRAAQFRERTAPVIAHYTAQGRVRTVVARAGETEEQVAQRVQQRLAPEIVLLLGPDAEAAAAIGRAAARAGREWLDAAELISREARTGSATGQRIRELQRRGEQLPTALVVQLLREAVERAGARRVCVTGFPRSLAECAAFEAELAPFARAVLVRSGRGTAASWAAAGQPLCEHLRATGRLVEVDNADLSTGQIVKLCRLDCTPRYAVLEHLPAQDNAETVRLELAALPRVVAAGASDAPAEPFFVLGLPESPDAKNEMEQLLAGKPLVCGIAPETAGEVVDEYALEGRLRGVEGALAAMRPQLVVVLGSAAAPKALAQLAREQSLTVLDLAKAVTALPACQGTWEARIVERARRAARQVLSADEADRLAADMVAAQLRVVDRALGAAVGRGVLLVGCDAAKPAVLAALLSRAQKVLLIEQDPKAAAAAAVPADADDAEELRAAAEKEAAVAQERLRALAPSGATVVAIASDAAALQPLRAPFAVEIVSLVAPRADETRTLCVGLAKRFGMVRVKAAELFRTEVERGTRHGRIIAEAMEAQRSIPLETSVAVLQGVITAAAGTGASSFLLDGFPTTSGETFPYAHDQLFALAKQCGPVKLCLHVTSGTSTASTQKVVGLFASMGQLVALDLYAPDMLEAAAQHIDALHAREAEERRKDSWKRGDGSPEAALQDVLDAYEPNRAEQKAAEEYWAQFARTSEYDVPLQEVVTKMAQWKIESKPTDRLQAAVTKAQWYLYVFQTLLNMEEAAVRKAREEEAKLKKQAEENKEADDE